MTARLFQTPIVLPHCGPILLENEHVDVKDCGAMPSYVRPGATRAEGTVNLRVRGKFCKVTG